jgi:protein involved in polysaccharide export with SLBB domain
MARLFALRGVALVALLLLVAAEPATREAPLQPGDLVRVTVNQLAGPNVPSDFLERVDADVWIALPLVGKLKVGKLSPAEAACAVDKIYHEMQLIGAANARIEHVQLNTKPPAPGPFAAGDFAHVQMWDLEGPGIETRLIKEVSADGKLDLPHGVSVKLAGLSDSDAEVAVAKAYHDAELINKLQVCVLRISAEEAKALDEQHKARAK